MDVRFYVLINFYDHAHRVDEKRCAHGAIIFAAHEFLFTPDAIFFDDFFFLIGQQSERQVVLLHELIMAFDRVNADAEHGQF